MLLMLQLHEAVIGQNKGYSEGRYELKSGLSTFIGICLCMTQKHRAFPSRVKKILSFKG